MEVKSGKSNTENLPYNYINKYIFSLPAGKEIIDKLNQYNIKYEEIASTESNCEYIVEEVMEEIRNEQ